MKKLIVCLALTLSSMSFLSSCGVSNSDPSTDDKENTGSFNGVTTPADITADNAQSLAIAATEGALQATSNNSAASGFGGFGGLSSPSIDKSTPIVRASKIIKNVNQAITDLSASLCKTGGTASISFPGELQDLANSGKTVSELTYTFNRCDSSTTFLDKTITLIMNGSVLIEPLSNNGARMTYRNFSITTNEGSETVNMTITCDGNDNCTTSGNFTGFDNRTYRTEDTRITGNAVNGYNIDATVFDPDEGAFTMTSTGLIFNCASDRPQSGGTITVTSKEVELVITFNSCTSFTATVNGISRTYNWFN